MALERRNESLMTTRSVMAAAILLVAPAAHAAGFAVDTQGSKAAGMATAVVANIDDPSAVFYNPAGMLSTDGVQAQVGVTLVAPTLHYTPRSSDPAPVLEQGVTTTNQFGISPPPHAFITAKLGDNLALGMGVFTNFGDALHWPPAWEGRFRALSTALTTFDANPSVALRVSDRIRVGVGAQAVVGTIEVVRKLNFIDTEATTDVTGSAVGFGYNAGVQVDAVKDVLSFGFAFRSGVLLKFRGTAHFETPPIEFANQTPTADLLKDQSLTSQLRTPNTAMLGVSFRPVHDLTLAADVHYYRWSSVQQIAVSFENPTLDQVLPKRWHDTFNFHLGAEYRLTSSLSLRAGAVYDPTPEPVDTLTPDLPDSNRLKATVGVGYARERMQFDLGYQFVYLLPVHSTAPVYEGDYSGSAHVVGLTFGYRL